MKIDDLKESHRIEDRRGQGGNYTGSSGGGLGANLLIQLLLSSGRGKWIVLLLLGIGLISGGTSFGDLLGLNTSSNYSRTYQNDTEITTSQVTDEEAIFISKVFQSTEDFWTQAFEKEGLTYSPPTLVIYEGQTNTACGTGNASSGPFYCSADRKVYIDLSFYRELSTTYKASGDFAMAYVIAHEVGHHVQTELGTMSAYAKARQGLSEKEANALNVRLELQADYYAGAWAKYVAGQGLLDKGDVEEAMTAAHAVGDDTLQEQAYGHSVPDSFTHGSSAQRQEWFNRGYQYGDLSHGDTFNSDI